MSHIPTATDASDATDPTLPARWTSRSRRSRATVLVAVGLLAMYSIFVARGAVAFSEKRSAPEIVPFFVWELFSRVPAPVQREYRIRMTAMDGTRLGEPVPYEETTLPMHQAGPAQNIMSALGHAYARGDVDALATYRTIWESRYLHPLTSASYQLVKVEYDIAERYECGCYRSETVITEFSMGQP